MFFNRGSVERKRRRVRPNKIKKRELNDICNHYRCIFWALSASKIICGWGSAPNPTGFDLECSPRPTSLLPPLQEPPSFGLEFHGVPRVDRFLPMPMGSVSNQNCCKKSSTSKKTLKNTDLGNDVVWNLLVWCMNICNTILIHFQKDILLRHSNCYCFIWEWYTIPTINHHWLSLSVSGCVRVFLIQSESSTTFRSRRQMFHDVSLPAAKVHVTFFPMNESCKTFSFPEAKFACGSESSSEGSSWLP